LSEIWKVIISLIMIKSLNPLEIDHFVQGQSSCTSCCCCHLPQLHCECRCTENAFFGNAKKEGIWDLCFVGYFFFRAVCRVKKVDDL